MIIFLKSKFWSWKKEKSVSIYLFISSAYSPVAASKSSFQPRLLTKKNEYQKHKVNKPKKAKFWNEISIQEIAYEHIEKQSSPVSSSGLALQPKPGNEEINKPAKRGFKSQIQVRYNIFQSFNFVQLNLDQWHKVRPTILSSWSPLFNTKPGVCSFFEFTRLSLGFERSKNIPRMKPMTTPGMKFSTLKPEASHSLSWFCCTQWNSHRN